MKIILLRHAEKLYNNGMSKDKRLDPPIKEFEKERCPVLLKEYVQTYDDIIPNKILTSPFRRCRETSSIIGTYFGDDSKKIDVEIVPELSEYLGFQRDIVPADFYFETYKNSPYGIDKTESLMMFENRVVHFMDKIFDDDYNGCDSDNIWIVTHGIFINYFLKNCGVSTPKIKPFKGAIIENDKIIFI